MIQNINDARNKLFSSYTTEEDYRECMLFFSEHTEDSNVQYLFHNYIPLKIKTLFPEVCWEMVQQDPILIKNMPKEILKDDDRLFEIVCKRPEIIRYLPQSREYPIKIYRKAIENANKQPNIIERIPEKYLRACMDLVSKQAENNINIYFYLPDTIKSEVPRPKGAKCYHLTNVKNIKGILSTGLQPRIGVRSSWLKEEEARVYYSIGEEASLHMAAAFVEKTRYSQDLDITDSLYLVFPDENIANKNEDNLKDSYTVQPIQPSSIKVCILENKRTR
jgi:hypothetical protein